VDPALNPLWIFGAGHVARALVPVLDGLPFSVSWIDSRSDAFPPAEGLSERISSILTDDPAGEIARAPRDAIHLVMTHNHDLDFAICRALLRRGEFRRLGLIGSDTKARRFAQRFAAQGVPPSQIARVVSPIGVAGIDSKLPAAIAVAIAAQLLQWIEISEPSSASDANIPAAPTTPFSSGIKA
jgi:xanthine dehydrogenase accessory factor